MLKERKITAYYPKQKRRKILISVICVILALIIAFVGAAVYYAYSLLRATPRTELDSSDLGIEKVESVTSEQGDYSAFFKFKNGVNRQNGIINIALFGLDTRDMSKTSGRSDATLILTVDTVHNKVKITSVARDSYVSVDGHGKTKLTHAYSYGGHQLAVKTLNQNFGLDIQDFVSVNFSQLADIIDYIGGVKINVSEDEKEVMKGYIDELNKLGIKTEYLTETGDVLLSGGQAVAYARNRYTGTDIDRMDRQYEVLVAMAQSAKNMSAAKYDKFLKMLLSECVTSLSDEEIISIGLWAASSSPEFERLVLPNGDCNASGKTINGLWYYVYDLDKAKQVLHSFIYEN
ncbi:MAG: LCP family protein [Clostridia bacterium]|nr:LCP family protein [Clostridia bacterium]